MMPDDPDMPENFERDMKNMLFMLVAFNCVYFGVTYMQKVDFNQFNIKMFFN